MNGKFAYQIAADAILIIHTSFIAFVVFGMALILVGLASDWGWVRNFWFRTVHLVAIGFVVIQAWMGRLCPLTDWESALRERAGGVAYSGSFISYWLQQLIYYEAEPWVFKLGYTVFAVLVVTTWLLAPPRRGKPRVGDSRCRRRDIE